MLNQPRPARTRWHERMASQQGLELGLLISRDDVLARMKPLPVKATFIEIQHPLGLLAKFRVARERPGTP
jgi:hypothetical protein